MSAVRAAGAVLILALSAAAAQAEDLILSERFFDVRFGFQQSSQVTLVEHVNSTVDVDWEGEAYHPRVSMEVLSGTTTEGVGLLYGLEASLGWENQLRARTSTLTYRYRDAAVNLMVGPQYGLDGFTGIHGHLELLAFGGVGYGWLQGDNVDTSVSTSGMAVGGIGRTSAMTYEGGIRGGAFVSEGKVTAGITMAYAFGGGSEFDVTNSRGGTTSVSPEFAGMRFGALAGVRF